MFIVYTGLVAAVFLVALAIFANRIRSHQEWDFELKPNCLLTRFPLLFVTGPRSLFYFSGYWNIYPSFLAEHGYEVFTVRLPWNKTGQRKQRLLDFLQLQEQQQRRFHLLVDPPTLTEIEEILSTHKPNSVLSLTEITDDSSSSSGPLRALPVPCATVACVHSGRAPFFQKLTYGLHRRMLSRYRLCSLEALGAGTDTAFTNAHRLLERAQTLAETDLRET